MNITEMDFTDGGNAIVIDRIDGGQYYAPNRIAFQQHGVMFEDVNVANGNSLVFVPYSNIKDITQPE